jgi:hypothetical protein
MVTGPSLVANTYSFRIRRRMDHTMIAVGVSWSTTSKAFR